MFELPVNFRLWLALLCFVFGGRAFYHFCFVFIKINLIVFAREIGSQGGPPRLIQLIFNIRGT